MLFRLSAGAWSVTLIGFNVSILWCKDSFALTVIIIVIIFFPDGFCNSPKSKASNRRLRL